MKLSISIPEEDWETACLLAGTDSPSAVVQDLILRAVKTIPGYFEWKERRLDELQLLIDKSK